MGFNSGFKGLMYRVNLVGILTGYQIYNNTRYGKLKKKNLMSVLRPLLSGWPCRPDAVLSGTTLVDLCCSHSTHPAMLK